MHGLLQKRPQLQIKRKQPRLSAWFQSVPQKQWSVACTAKSLCAWSTRPCYATNTTNHSRSSPQADAGHLTVRVQHVIHALYARSTCAVNTSYRHAKCTEKQQLQERWKSTCMARNRSQWHCQPKVFQLSGPPPHILVPTAAAAAAAAASVVVPLAEASSAVAAPTSHQTSRLPHIWNRHRNV